MCDVVGWWVGRWCNLVGCDCNHVCSDGLGCESGRFLADGVFAMCAMYVHTATAISKTMGPVFDIGSTHVYGSSGSYGSSLSREWQRPLQGSFIDGLHLFR